MHHSDSWLRAGMIDIPKLAACLDITAQHSKVHLSHTVTFEYLLPV